MNTSTTFAAAFAERLLTRTLLTAACVWFGLLMGARYGSADLFTAIAVSSFVTLMLVASAANTSACLARRNGR